MNLLTLIVGMPSTGKTTAFRNLGSETVMYVTEQKILPFQNKGIKVVITPTINDLLNKLSRFKVNSYPQITNVVVDFTDFSDMLMSECKSKYTGFGIYNNYNKKLNELFLALKAVDKYVFLICHPEVLHFSDVIVIFRVRVHGKYHAGRIERLSTCIFFTDPKRKPNGTGVEYRFLTRFPAKTPFGLFDHMFIDNDVSQIVESYEKFYAHKNPLPVMNAATAA